MTKNYNFELSFTNRHHIHMRYLLLLLNLLISLNGLALINTIDVKTLRLFNDPNVVSTQYYDFCLDQRGLLWIASSSGLVRFDGSNIDVFRHDDVPGSISSNTVNKVMCDSRGNIWVGTADGLYSFDQRSEKFTLVTIPADGLNGYIIDITEQADGTVVFMVSGVGLFVVDESSGKPEGVKLGYLQEHTEMNSLASTRDGGLIAGNHSGDLFRLWANGNMKRYHISKDFFIGIRKENDMSVIAFTAHGIWRVNTATMATSPIDISELGETTINNVCVGQDGTAYIATDGKGLWIMEPGGKSIHPMNNLYNPVLNIDKSKIGTVYMAPDGNLWIGCNYYGVLLAPSTPMPFNYYPLSPALKNFHGGISATAADKDGLWLAFERGEAVHMSNSHEILHHLKLPSDHEIRALRMGQDGMLYAVTTNDALWQINPADCSHKRLTDIKRSCVRYYIEIGGDDFQTLFLGMHGDGILKYDLKTGEEKLFTTKELGEEKLHNNWISSTYIDSSSRLWIGLFSGLACYDIEADTFKIIEQKHYLKGSCNAFGEMCDGRILIGTSNGLIIYNPDNDKVEKKMTSIDGLVDNHIRTIEIDSTGRAWIGTDYGLSHYDPSTGRLTSLKGGYGLSETNVMLSAYNKELDRMFLIGSLGYTKFSPSSIRPVKFTSPIAVTGVYLNGEKVTESQMTGNRPTIVTDSLSRFRGINITHRDNNLILRLSPMDFRDLANLTYEWLLDSKNGSDSSWIATRQGNSTIEIHNLEPGTHKLLIRAVDNDVYSDITELTISVSPPWYLTPRAKILYFLVIMGILALIYMLIKKQNTEKINEAKVRFFMNISHDIRSPVTCIINPLQVLLRKEHDQETTAMLKTMQRNADRILSLTNQLLELRKIDKGKKRLSMQQTELKSFAMELVELFRQFAEKKSIAISLDAPYEISDLWIDRTNFDKVLVNLISNAIKYTPEGGKVVIRLSTMTDNTIGRCASISVIDTGIGLDPKNISKIFDRFYQGQGSASGFGVGLDLARQLVILHHGTLTASNRTDGVKGSVFTVLLPLGKDHLSPDEIASEDASHAVTSESSRHIKHEPISADSTPDTIRKTRKKSTGRRILIVDDDNELRRYMCMHFSKTDKVFEAANGADAKKILLDNKIDIVVSDVVMPDIDGLELLKAIKSNTDTTHMPVILLSSRIDIADRMAGWDRGADGYIGKPFDISELDAMIDNLIGNRLRLKGKYSGAQDTDKNMALPEIKGNDEILMDKIMKAINNRIEDPQLNVEELGIEVGISRAHLHRKMKELIGMTPSDYIRNVRLRKACEILKKPDVDITQVAYKLGFTSQPHFSTAFKKFTGVSPSEYRSHNAE